MANEVYANGREVSCKAASGQTICAFPDVCFTPPENPATPPGVPVPYANTGSSSDTTNGTKTVKISGQEVGIKNTSYFKTSMGDEAGCAAKKGIITSANQGKVYFKSWSMDVKFEGENAVRHLDMTTNNHKCDPGDTPPWVYVDAAAIGDAECKKVVNAKNDCMKKHTEENVTQSARADYKKPGVSAAKAKKSAVGDTSLVDWDALLQDEDAAPQAAVQRSFCADDDCKDKLNCALVPYNGFCCPAPDKANGVAPKTPHHVVPAHCFLHKGGRSDGKAYDHVSDYEHEEAPCICLDGVDKSETDAAGKTKEHGLVHEELDAAEAKKMTYTPALTPTGKQKMSGGEPVYDREAGTWSFGEANEAGCNAVAKVKTDCDAACLQRQSEAAHKEMVKNLDSKTPLRADPFGSPRTPEGFVPAGSVPAAPAPS